MKTELNDLFANNWYRIIVSLVLFALLTFDTTVARSQSTVTVSCQGELWITHEEQGYSGLYTNSGQIINGQPVFIHYNVTAPEGSAYRTIYLYRHRVGFTASGFVWVLQPVAPDPNTWKANAYSDGATPWSSSWNRPTVKVECRSAIGAPNSDKLDVTFFVTADVHVVDTDRGMSKQVAIDHAEMMNTATSYSNQNRIVWPAQTTSAGTYISDPVAVFIAGDLTNDKAHQRFPDNAKLFDELYLRKPAERTNLSLRFQAYPGAGNHDWSSQSEWYSQAAHDANWQTFRDIEKTLEGNPSIFRPGNIPGLGSSYPPHYTVNFGKLLVVNLNTSIGEPCRQLTLAGRDKDYFYTLGHYIEPDADNCNAKQWLKDQLEAHKNKYGDRAPIIIVQHYGFDSFSQSTAGGYRGYWWHPDYRKMFAEIIKPYNVIAMFHGHDHGYGLTKAGTDGPENLIFGSEITSQSIDPGWNEGRAWADFNGDGKADYCRAVDRDKVRVTLSTGTGFGSEITSQSIDPGYNEGRTWADVNGDGKADYCRTIGGGKLRVTLSTGTSFGSEITSQSIDLGWNEGRAWADFNGDGKADYCRAVGSDKVRVLLSTGTGFGSEITSPSIDLGYNEGRTWTDVNGDGKADYCRTIGGGKVRVTPSAGTGFGSEITSQSIDLGYNEGRAWADVDGDGDLDYCRVVHGNTLVGSLRALLFTGSGFGSDIESGKRGETGIFLDPGYPDAARAWQDRNGDHKADFLRVIGDGGSRFLTSRILGSGTDLNGPDLTSRSLDAGWNEGRAWADFNGDGKLDYCRAVDRDKVRVTLSEIVRIKAPIDAYNVPSGFGVGSGSWIGGFMAVRVTDSYLDVAPVIKDNNFGYSVKDGYTKNY